MSVGSFRVHQATGMVIAQAGVSPAEALQRLCFYADAVGAPLDDVARQVVDRAISFASVGYMPH
ncbi:ANTAR domain-containing protein [Lacisediminihabitans sp. H27-G8]|uniref:ANTAR domain-containing protein n=1 Tax=Lacisediminihabitans sp. H27-G8 TaxID=3111909 RepID=UPI0038FD2807